MISRLITLLALSATIPTLASAQCRINVPGVACTTVPVATPPDATERSCRIGVPGTACKAVARTPRPAPVDVGEFLERGEYSMMMNARYYGLPDVRDGWVYMQIENDIYRVDYRSHEVLERVTDQANRNW